MYYVYVLSSEKRKYIYVGLTKDLDRRVKEHQTGSEVTTRPYRPFTLILVEKFNTRIEAREREKYLKSGIGKEYLKVIINAQVAKLVDALP